VLPKSYVARRNFQFLIRFPLRPPTRSKMRGKYDLHPSLFILGQLLLLLALIHGCHPTARRHNWIFFIPISTLCIYSCFFCASDSATSDYPFIQVFINLIPTSTDYILLRHQQPELRKIGQKKPTAEMSFTERLAWASSLLSTSRGIGWAHEPTSHIPPRPTASRGTFIVSQILWIIPRYILFDAALIHIRQNPCYRTGGPSLGAFGWEWRTTAWVFIVSIYCSMNNLYAALSIVAVATGLYEPRDWPSLFGSPLDAYTVRNCWGYVLTYPNLSFSIIEKSEPTVAYGTKCSAKHSPPTPTSSPPLSESYSHPAHSEQPTSNYTPRSSSPGSSTRQETTSSTTPFPKAALSDFSSSKQWESRSRMVSSPSSPAWDTTRNP
jgi:hypothetical protein